MEAQCVVKVRHDVGWCSPEDGAAPLDGDRADLLDVGLGVLSGHLVIERGVIAGVHVFCAVLAWSRVRFVRFASTDASLVDPRASQTSRAGARSSAEGLN